MLPYERFAAWRSAHELALLVHRLTSAWPRDERFGLTAQARSAAFSAAANICEGSARRGPREFRRFLDASLGSLSELAYILRLAGDLGFPDREGLEQVESVRARAGRQLWGLYRSVAARD